VKPPQVYKGEEGPSQAATRSRNLSRPGRARACKARPALSGVSYLLKYLVTLAAGVPSQGFYLLCEGVTAECLLVCGDARVENGLLQAVAVRIGLL
jgi:hypothetical protein